MVNFPIIDYSSIEDINEPIVKAKFEELADQKWCLGIMLWGSRATGFGAPDTDWDALIYVTREHFATLTLEETAIIEKDDKSAAQRLILDLSLVSDDWFEIQLQSPLDIDHFSYEEGVVILDKTGKLEEWRLNLAQYPHDEHEDRLKNKYLQLLIAYYYANIDDKRNFPADRQLNLHRATIAAVNLWFALKKSWTPPLKWWSKHVKKLGMEDSVYLLFTSAFEKPTIVTVGNLMKSLREMINATGLDFPKNPQKAFLETLHPNGREKQIRHSYS